MWEYLIKYLDQQIIILIIVITHHRQHGKNSLSNYQS